ncbi:MAE_28990/MAE_18760 family HEPN-like nuclease [Pseudomonas putida]
MRIRSSSEFEDYVASEYAWRRKELTNISNVARSGRKGMQESLFRSAIPIIYAHWEGFVKQASIAKLRYLISKGYKYCDLHPCFHVYAILDANDGRFPAKRFEPWIDVTSGKLNLQASLSASSIRFIDANSNLNSEVLREIAVKVGVSYQAFELKANWLDEVLLGTRNRICHGERAPVKEEEFDDVYNETTALIDLYKNEILNSVYQQTYLKAV